MDPEHCDWAPGDSAQELYSPTRVTCLDEWTNEMDVDGLERRQAEQVIEETRRRRREQTGGWDLLVQMRMMMEDVIRKEKGETWEKMRGPPKLAFEQSPTNRVRYRFQGTMSSRRLRNRKVLSWI